MFNILDHSDIIQFIHKGVKYESFLSLFEVLVIFFIPIPSNMTISLERNCKFSYIQGPKIVIYLKHEPKILQNTKIRKPSWTKIVI